MASMGVNYSLSHGFLSGTQTFPHSTERKLSAHRCRAAKQNNAPQIVAGFFSPNKKPVPKPRPVVKPVVKAPRPEYQGAGHKRQTVKGADAILSGTVWDALGAAAKAVETAPVRTVGTVAAYTGVATIGTLMASSLLGSIDTLPIIPATMQAVGMAYCGLVTTRYFNGSRRLSLEPLSPMQAILEFVDGPSITLKANKKAEGSQLAVQKNELGIQQLQQLGTQLGRVVAEKEALQAVAKQLSAERDEATAEVNALKVAVHSMTERMKSIEAMLEREVKELHTQNAALELLAGSLAIERDEAVVKVGEVEGQLVVVSREKESIEALACDLILERDEAMAEVEELKRINSNLSEAAGSASGLTAQQEVFLKQQAKVARGKFVDVSKPYAQQREQVDEMVKHLVEEFGAPAGWTSEYIQRFLDSSALTNKAMGGVKSEQNAEKKTMSF